MSEWHKSSYSGATNECLEVREQVTEVAVRDTQHRHLGHLSFPSPEWSAFVREVKDGRI
ncbi:hypothetical protein F4561_003791 [Lipingzhangella halophila]|uniref:DUF397 domain-containing protein n=1 Tax=Lipingzhangella halophila TaxID=1783352 RepID=A0A7W7W3N3_9ACTN|nr:DUF397 domain-containing protein [Lipingzhangella halophila]MBB4932971.1 hypothetical protein [Lipingzhangella halophila]